MPNMTRTETHRFLARKCQLNYNGLFEARKDFWWNFILLTSRKVVSWSLALFKTHIQCHSSFPYLLSNLYLLIKVAPALIVVNKGLKF